MNQTFTRECLQSLPAKHRSERIRDAVNNLYHTVIDAATRGKAFHMVDVKQFTPEFKKKYGTHCHPPPAYVVTIEDLVEGFKEKFPRCHVEYVEMWEDVRPGVREQKNGILVNWS
jgi:hypothetical protein